MILVVLAIDKPWLGDGLSHTKTLPIRVTPPHPLDLIGKLVPWTSSQESSATILLLARGGLILLGGGTNPNIFWPGWF